MKHFYDALLLEAPGIGKVRLEKLKAFFGDAETAWQATDRDLSLSGILSGNELENLLLHRAKVDPIATVATWHNKGIGVCSINDPQYPRLLQQCYDPPAFLFYRGCLQADSVCLAVVGSRRSTPYGRNVARSFSESLSRAGVTIVSGAARGIDAAAHEGALAAGAVTIAVLGSGVDMPYPAENRRLIDQIAETGCVISEYPPGTPPAAGRFPARNRIVAGMSVGVLVVEAAEKSGALITADLAMEENRDVYAVPGSIFSEASRGTHRLIQQGARLISCVDDILEDMGLTRNVTTDLALPKLTDPELKILSCLSYEQPKSVEELLADTDLAPAGLQVLLLQMEMAGHVEKDITMRYTRRAARE